MLEYSLIGETTMFDKGIHKRIKIVLLIVIFVFLLVIGKVFYIEVIEYRKLNTLASGLWSRNLPIEADRGKIYTVDGEAVAGNLTTTSLVFIPNQIKDKDLVATKISEILGVDKSVIEEHLYKKSQKCSIPFSAINLALNSSKLLSSIRTLKYSSNLVSNLFLVSLLKGLTTLGSLE